MKILIFLVSSLAITSTFELHSVKVENQRKFSVSAEESKNWRITNGQFAVAGQFPYQVSLRWQLDDFYYSYCGGSLIGQNWVITAAHCTQGIQAVTVFLGSLERESAEISYTVYGDNIIVHADYDELYFNNDISLIKIPTVAYSATIQPIRLPAISSSYSSYVGSAVIASGWGDTSKKVRVSNYLKWARMEVISNDFCARYFSDLVNPSSICISTYGGVSTCHGDSGGPLVLEDENILVGVTSFGPEVCASSPVAGFTRVTSYLDWIQYYTDISY